MSLIVTPNNERLIELKRARILRLQEINKVACESSLYNFVKMAWPIIEPGCELVDNWHIKTICGYLEAVTAGDITRLIINVPPGSLKSILVSVMWPAWEWTKKPEERYLTVSNAQDLAIRDALKMKQIVSSEWYQSNWPIEFARDQNEKTLFVNDHKGFRQAQGIGAANTGKRGSRIIVDDPIDTAHSHSQPIRDGVNFIWDRSLSTRVNDPEKSAIVGIMQRCHEDDWTGHVAKKSKRPWLIIPIPMMYEGQPTFDAGRDIGKPELNDPRTKLGQLMFSKFFTRNAVLGLKEDLGDYGTASQLNQRPVPDGGGIIKTHWWRIWPADKPLPLIEHVFLSYDTAFSEPEMKRAAYSAQTRWGIFWDEQRQRHCIICLGRWYDRCGYDLLRQKAKEWDTKYEPDAHLIEKKATGISLIQDLRRALPGKVRSYCPGKGEDKVSRAHAVSPDFQAGLVYIVDKPWARNQEKTGLIDFVAAFPNGSPPCADLTDTVTQAVLYLKNHHWVSHPDDDDKEQPPKELTEEEIEDTDNTYRNGPYG